MIFTHLVLKGNSLNVISSLFRFLKAFLLKMGGIDLMHIKDSK